MEGIRLQKYIAMCGVASRRKAEELIDSGIVSVNGETISVQGYKVMPGDSVSVDGREISPERKKVYILLNKPRGVVSTASDEAGRKTVLDMVEGISERLYPVGRLDYSTTGLIILTNDGSFTEFMTHPSHNISKTYVAVADGEFEAETLLNLGKGIDIGGYVTAPAKVTYNGNRTDSIIITIYEGKNRQVRRMAEAVGLRVKSLKRVGIGNIRDSRLKPGEWRHLTLREIRGLGYDID
jgi:23S rRNA pseudouridine2605 synthase